MLCWTLDCWDAKIDKDFADFKNTLKTSWTSTCDMVLPTKIQVRNEHKAISRVIPHCQKCFLTDVYKTRGNVTIGVTSKVIFGNKNIVVDGGVFWIQILPVNRQQRHEDSTWKPWKSNPPPWKSNRHYLFSKDRLILQTTTFLLCKGNLSSSKRSFSIFQLVCFFGLEMCDTCHVNPKFFVVVKRCQQKQRQNGLQVPNI